METETRCSWLSKRISDVAENIRWAVFSPYKFLFICYVADAATQTEVRTYTLPNDIEYTGVANLVRRMRNLEDLVWCLPDYAANKCFVTDDDAVQQLDRQMHETMCNNFGALRRVGYTATAFDDVKALIDCGVCCMARSLVECLEDLSLRTDKFTPLDERYYTIDTGNPHYVITQATAPHLRMLLTEYFADMPTEQEVLPTDLAIQCHDVLAKRTMLYTGIQSQSTCYMPELLRVEALSRGMTLRQICYKATSDITAYRNGLTKDLLYTLSYAPGKLAAVNKVRIDALGYLYINDMLVNYIVDFDTLLHMPDETVWCAVAGYTQDEFYELYFERFPHEDTAAETAGMTTFVRILQEQHIPRWGILLDLTLLTAFTELSELRIDNADIAVRFTYEMSGTTAFRKLTKANLYICGCSTEHPSVLTVAGIPIREFFLRACVLMSNSLRSYLHLHTDRRLVGRTLHRVQDTKF